MKLFALLRAAKSAILKLGGIAMTDSAWPHPYAEVKRAGTTVTASLLPGVGEGARAVAGLIAVARKLARCDCASIARADDVTIEPTRGRIVVTTKKCPGQSAERLRAAGTIPIARVARIVAAVIEALRAAHGIGVFHRALSLASVVVDGDDVRVLDFGLGELLTPESPHATVRLLALTPERIFGLPAAATEDVYLLGCIAYHLVSGAPPLVDDQDDDAARLRRRHAIEDPPRLSRTGPSAVPSVLGRVIERCLAKESDDRYADMDALAEAWAKAMAEAGLGKPGAAPSKPARPEAPPATPSSARATTGPRPVVPPPPTTTSTSTSTSTPSRPPLPRAVSTPVRPATSVRPAPRPSAPAPPPIAIDASPTPAPTATPTPAPTPIGDEPPSAPIDVAIEVTPPPTVASIEPSIEPPPVLAAAPIASAPPLAVRPAPRSHRGVIAAVVGLAAVVAIAFMATRDDSNSADEHGARPGDLAQNRVAPAPAEPTQLAGADSIVEPTEPPTPTVITVPAAAPTPAPTVAAAAPSEAIEPAADDTEDPIVEVGAAPTVVASDERSADLLRRANESRRAGRTGEALALYKQALALEPKNGDALSAIARIYFDRGAFSDAVAWGKRVVDAEPTSAKARLALGDAYFKLGKLAQAETQYRKADKLGHRLAESRLAAVRTSP